MVVWFTFGGCVGGLGGGVMVLGGVVIRGRWVVVWWQSSGGHGGHEARGEKG